MNYQKGGKHFVKKTLFILALLCRVGFGYPSLPEARTETEALFVRRIIDFWRDKEYPFAKSQIRAFMNNYPESPFSDHFYAMLGDIAMHEKAYQEALDFYNRISDEAFTADIQAKRWQALYQLKHYTQLYQEIAPLELDENDEEGRFYFAEAAFREALTLLSFPESKEEAKELCTEALPLYASLTFSEAFSSHAKLAMAEIYRLLEKPEIAADLYLEIAKDKQDNEEVLFHAAMMLMQCDIKKAASLFEGIARGDSKRRGDAAYQWLQILANQEEWKTIEHERDLWLAKVPKKRLGTAYFYLGMIAFEKGRHYQALSDLQKALDGGVEAPHDAALLEALLMSSKELNNLDLCEKCHTLLTERYPGKRPEAGYLRATAYRQSGDLERALTHLEELKQQFPNHFIAENASVEKVQIHMKEKNWEEAHAGVIEFLHTYPQSKQKGEMLRLAIDLSQKQLAEEELYAQLVEDLERAFAARIFQDEEHIEKEELLVKSYLKLDRIHAALGILHEMEEADPLLFAQCYIKEGSSPEKVIVFAEQALERYPENKRLHLHLFNTYLKVAKEQPDEALTQRAAEHLEAVIDLFPVSLENRLWLAHYFAKKQNERAIGLLESLLQTENNWKRFDEEGLILARLYQRKGDFKKALTLLERVIALKQKTKPEAELILAEVFLELGEKEKAEALFSKLEDSPYLPLAYSARLQMARLHFDEQPRKHLKNLHDIKVHKTLANEPIHLEAALDYADLQTRLLPEEKRTASLLASLLEVKEAFTTERDICSKDYHECRQLMPEKDLIYQAYMRYIDARIYQLQAQMAKNPQEGKVKEKVAQELFSTLCKGKYAVSKYLVERATAGMYGQ